MNTENEYTADGYGESADQQTRSKRTSWSQRIVIEKHVDRFDSHLISFSYTKFASHRLHSFSFPLYLSLFIPLSENSIIIFFVHLCLSIIGFSVGDTIFALIKPRNTTLPYRVHVADVVLVIFYCTHKIL